uniref:Maelstrom domain-containing protein n=1 Tax=Tetranychus urticae TaxID=32264 RepID=A0A158P513_TETUR
MDIICAYFDTQGFSVDGTFLPREICLLNDSATINLMVDQIYSKPTDKEKIQIEYLTNKFHGLELVPKASVKEDYAKTLIKLFYEFSRDGRKYYMACKSKESENYLTELHIPVLNILQVYGATHKTINRDQKPCTFHNRDDNYLKCSLNIVQDMKIFIDNMDIGRIEHD